MIVTAKLTASLVVIAVAGAMASGANPAALAQTDNVQHAQHTAAASATQQSKECEIAARFNGAGRADQQLTKSLKTAFGCPA